MPLLSSFKHPLQKYHAKFNLSPLLSVLPFVVLSTVMNFSVVPKADKMCGDSSLCCCQGKCQHVTRHFTSQMKRDPFLVLPHASSPVCAAWMDIMNGLSLAVCVWPTMVLWDICILQSTVYHLCVVCVIGAVRKIP